MNKNAVTLVIGASTNPERYSYLAIQRLRAGGHAVAAIGSRPGKVEDINIATEKIPLTDIDTVTLYINPALQKNYYQYILSLHPRRIIFNPGTENPELYDMAKNNNIEALEACTLVLLSSRQY